MSSSMRSEYASIPTRGSRFVGLLSMIMTSVLGSGGCEQESSGPTTAQSIKKIVVILSEAKDLLPAWAARTAALRIRYLPQDCRPLRSGRRWYVAWSAMPGLVGEQGERDGLFRFCRNTEFVGEMQADA